MRTIVATLFLVLTARAGAAEVSFSKEIAPIFVAKCLACHNAEKAKGGYRLHNFESLLKPGSSKDAPVVSGKPAESKIVELLTANDEDDRMPQKDEPLPAAQIALIKTWIKQGAMFDGPDRSVSLAVLSPPVHPAAPRSYHAAIPITALAFDLSGENLAVCGYHEITIWNSHKGELARRIGNIAERTFALAFSPDGRWLACVAGTPGKLGEVRLFEATNGELAKVLVTTADAVLCLDFSSDGKKLAAGGSDNVIRIWDVDSGRQLQNIEQHADWVLALAFSPNGERLASGSRDKSARIFEVESGELEETYTGHSDFVTAVAWANAKSVLSASRTRTVHRWNVKDTKKSAELSSWDAEPTRLIVDGTNLFSASLDGRVRQHNIESKELVRTFEPHREAVYSLALHAATQRLASGNHDGEILVWNVEDGKLLLKFVAAPGYTPALSRSR